MARNIVIKAPDRSHEQMPDHEREDTCFIFTAGSIEMGKAEDWQTRTVKYMEDVSDLVFLNPRRDDWDSSWKQSITDPQFNEQVTWEMDNLDFADYIIVYFDPATMSPITLLEVGLHAKSNKMLVCCPDGFWRKGNIEMVCKRFHIPLFNTLEEMLDRLKFLIGYRRQGEYE